MGIEIIIGCSHILAGPEHNVIGKLAGIDLLQVVKVSTQNHPFGNLLGSIYMNQRRFAAGIPKLLYRRLNLADIRVILNAGGLQCCGGSCRKKAGQAHEKQKFFNLHHRNLLKFSIHTLSVSGQKNFI